MGERRSRRRVLRHSGIALASALAGCTIESAEDEPASVDADAVVTVGPGGAFEFAPETVEIERGQTVGWVWDSSPHDVAPTSIPADADWEGEPELSGPGHTYEHAFDVAGTYEYQCTPHAASGMVGTVVVEASGDDPDE